ncbi:hypothetical protein BU15DRAFT_68772 [Melanogaster broomeanus]|nr:hypothetical protein BU15DRAFT_68772 [Melanogaster broomeanus]
MHLKTMHEFFQYLSSLFEMKMSDATQWEAARNPRICAGTHQKCSEDSCKARDHETAAKKAKSTIVEEPRDATCRKLKHDMRSQGRVKRRDRRGKRATGWKGKQGVTVTGLGEGTTDQNICNISQAAMPSSQNVNGRDVDTCHAHDTPLKPQTVSQTTSEAATDAANPNAMSARPTGPVGTLPRLQVEPHEIAGDSVRGQDKDICHTNIAPNETPPTARNADKEACQAEMPMHETTAPPSMPLKGEQDSRVTSDNAGAHSEGAALPGGTVDVQDGTQTQRTLHVSRTAQHAQPEQLHNEQQRTHQAQHARQTLSTLLEEEQGHEPSSNHTEDPGRCMGQEDAHATMNHHNGKVQSLPLKGEQNGDVSGSDHEPEVVKQEVYQKCQDEPEASGRMHTSTAPPNASATVVHTHTNAPSMPIEGEERRPSDEAVAYNMSHNPGGSICRQSQSRRVKGEIGDRINRDGNGQDSEVSGDDGAMSNTSCQAKPGPPTGPVRAQGLASVVGRPKPWV